MPPITPIQDHVAYVLEDLISFFSNAENLKKLIGVIVEESNELETELVKLWTDTTLQTATGDSLKQWGLIVGQSRIDGWTDEEYRLAIQTKIDINLGQGEVTRLIRIISTLVETSVRYRQRGRAHYSLEWLTASPTSALWLEHIANSIRDLTPAGVSWEAEEGRPGVFRFNSGPGFDQGKLASRVI